MKYKIAFFDMDHTLYDSETGHINKEDLEAIKKLKDAGVKICVATGRPLNQMNHILEHISFEYLVLINGAYVLNEQHEVIYKNPIKDEDFEDIYQWAYRHNYPLSIHFGDITYIYWGEELQDAMWKSYNVIEGIEATKNTLYHKDHAPYNTIITAPFEEVEAFVQTNSSLRYDKIEDGTYDIFTKDNDKCFGIEVLLKKLGLSWEQTIAFGDSTNDLMMLSKAGLGVAMGNAHELAKQNANYITKSIKEHGISDAIHKILDQEIS